MTAHYQSSGRRWLRRLLTLAAVLLVVALALVAARELCRMSYHCPWSILY